MTTLQSVGLTDSAVIGEESRVTRQGRQGKSGHNHRALEREMQIVEFQKIVGSLIELVDQLAKAAESEKMKAIGARNLLKSIAKQREAQEQQLQALIAEKKMQLERYRIEYETLCKIEADQNEFIDQFIFQK
ncbi:PREDICTED: intraflagellar transport protein 20 homolog [Charadrius vociferus]|uniref:intraflagellar transport protein 20 homolog n=1 Tax=Charadrius vociferus TaxID=50402 RepID=UPI00052161B9|nr:PREDICTED: intraflagellar transport protein 20 homolog [Charadrius vociferus]